MRCMWFRPRKAVSFGVVLLSELFGSGDAAGPPLLFPQLLCLHDFSLELLLQLFLDFDLDFFFFGVQDLLLLLYFRLEP